MVGGSLQALLLIDDEADVLLFSPKPAKYYDPPNDDYDVHENSEIAPTHPRQTPTPDLRSHTPDPKSVSQPGRRLRRKEVGSGMITLIHINLQ